MQAIKFIGRASILAQHDTIYNVSASSYNSFNFMER